MSGFLPAWARRGNWRDYSRLLLNFAAAMAWPNRSITGFTGAQTITNWRGPKSFPC